MILRSLLTLSATFFLFSAITAEEIEVPLILAPGKDNPRNSEGDFVRLKDGRLLYVYTRFTGGKGSDHDKAELVSRASADDGKTWTKQDQLVVANEGDWNVMSVSLLRLADGGIALFYLRKNSLTDCRPVVRFSNDEAATWSDPVLVIPDRDTGYFVLNNDRVIQLKNGRLIAPVALHNRPGWEKPDWQGEITAYLSDDAGKTWKRSTTIQKVHDASGKRITAQEPGVVELKNGEVLMWVRTNAGDQFKSVSTDGGETWPAFEPMGLPSPVSPASIERIPSTGDLVVLWNDHSDLPVAERKARTPFSVATSRDDGITWEKSKTIDPNPLGWFCYTAIEFVGDHVLLGHCEYPGLRSLQITRAPIDWLYQSQ